jgi:hypothetical protein
MYFDSVVLAQGKAPFLSAKRELILLASEIFWKD